MMNMEERDDDAGLKGACVERDDDDGDILTYDAGAGARWGNS
jgi:hypothetical protein